MFKTPMEGSNKYWTRN